MTRYDLIPILWSSFALWLVDARANFTVCSTPLVLHMLRNAELMVLQPLNLSWLESSRPGSDEFIVDRGDEAHLGPVAVTSDGS
jgi:hypothetical protein